MKLGISYWGFCEEYNDSNIVDTPDGGRFTRPILVKELFNRGIDIICLQQQRETNPLAGLVFDKSFPKIDALFIEYRWSTYKNDALHPLYNDKYYEPDLDRQTKLINHYVGRIPIIVWDTDLKVNPSFIEKYANNIIFTEPTLICKNARAISMPYFTDYDLQLFDVQLPKMQICYIGSNYERYWAVNKYFLNIGEQCKANGINIEFYGNWLNVSPERPEQQQFVNDASKYIHFNKRNKFLEGMKIMNESICTIHLTKQEYFKHMLITPRYFESIAANTIALIPEEFSFQLYGDEFKADSDVFQKIMSLSQLTLEEREKTIKQQKANAIVNAPMTSITAFVDKLLMILGV